MTIATGRSQRFRGQPTQQPILHVSAALALAAIAGLAVTGLLTPWTAVTFFAIGAGAGYSLSGSV